MAASTSTSGTSNVAQLSKYLKIVSKGAVYNNLSEDSPAWDYIKKKKKGDEEGRFQNFLLRSAYGAAAARFLRVGGGAYPKGHKSNLTEGTAQYKDFGLTVEVERAIVARAMNDMSKYGEPLAEELRAKTMALSRVLSAALYQDGTGVIGQVKTTAGTTSGNASVTLTLESAYDKQGFIGWFEPGDRIINMTSDGAQDVPSVDTGTCDYLEVMDKDRDNNTVTLAPRSATHGNLTFATDASAFPAGARLYRGTYSEHSAGDITIGDPTNPGVDYNTLSDSWVGLRSLAQRDSRIVNGVTLAGSLGGTRKNCGGNPLDSRHFQQTMSKLMIAAGNNRYKYKGAMMAWESLDALVESRETDRRFQSIEDTKRGVKELGYQHGKNGVVFQADEFCPKSEIYIIPEGDALQFYGTPAGFVKPEGGSKFHLRPNASGYDRVVQTFMEGQGTLICVHPGAIGVIENFTIA